MRRGTKCLTPPCRRFSTTVSTTSELNICTFIFWWWNGLTIFPFLRWTIVPTARLPPALIALSGCLLSIDSQLLPVKFNCPFSPLQILSNCSQEPWLSYTHILRNCCRLALFASAPWNSWPCVEGRGVGIFTGSCGKNWSSCCVCIVQQADKLMILNQDFFFLGGEGTFWVFFLENGKCKLFPHSWWLFLKQRRLVTLAHTTWHGPLSKWRLPKTEMKKPCSPHLQGKDRQGLTDSISSPSFMPALGCRRRCPLLRQPAPVLW